MVPQSVSRNAGNVLPESPRRVLRASNYSAGSLDIRSLLPGR